MHLLLWFFVVLLEFETRQQKNPLINKMIHSKNFQLEHIINELCEKSLEEVLMVLNAAALLDIEAELSPSAGKPREVDSTLPEIRVKIIDEKRRSRRCTWNWRWTSNISNNFPSTQNSPSSQVAHIALQKRNRNEEGCRKGQRVCAKRDHEAKGTKNNQPILR